ncbi:MAG TPA: hypothetical protein VGM50_17260, partial [Gemmatimonadaceae bacterium]
MHNSRMRFVACTATVLAVVACSKSDNAKVDTTTPQPASAMTPAASTATSDSMILVRGTVSSINAT